MPQGRITFDSNLTRMTGVVISFLVYLVVQLVWGYYLDSTIYVFSSFGLLAIAILAGGLFAASYMVLYGFNLAYEDKSWVRALVILGVAYLLRVLCAWAVPYVVTGSVSTSIGIWFGPLWFILTDLIFVAIVLLAVW